MKLFEWLGSLMAILCLMEVVHNPKQVLLDIQNGPVPSLRAFNCKLNRIGQSRAADGRVNPSRPNARRNPWR